MGYVGPFACIVRGSFCMHFGTRGCCYALWCMCSRRCMSCWYIDVLAHWLVAWCCAVVCCGLLVRSCGNTRFVADFCLSCLREFHPTRGFGHLSLRNHSPLLLSVGFLHVSPQSLGVRPWVWAPFLSPCYLPLCCIERSIMTPYVPFGSRGFRR